LMFLTILTAFEVEISASDFNIPAKVSFSVIKYSDSSKQIVNKPIITNVLLRIRIYTLSRLVSGDYA